MSARDNTGQSDLFLVRIWSRSDPEGSSGRIYRGKVQRAVGGEVRHFDGWEGLTDLLLAMLTKGDKHAPAATEDERVK